MPIKKSAIKALKVSKRQAKENKLVRARFKRAIKNVSLADDKKQSEAYKKAQSVVDRAVKLRIIHRNKAARLKSRLARNINQK